MIKKNKNILHLDVMEDVNNSITTKFTEDENGYLDGQAIVTNVGVFTYRDGKGGFIRELRPPEEVFDEESLKTLQMLPLTHAHPKDLVDMGNIKKLQKGSTGDTVTANQYAVSVPMKVTDKDTIIDIKENNKKALSCGYKADLDFTPGNWMGIPYDAIQRNIRYNHIAVGIEKGRAGDLAKMRFDSNDIDENVHIIDKRETSSKNNNIVLNKKTDGKEKKMPDNFRKIILDSVEYQAEKEVIDTLSKLKKDNASMKEQLKEVETNHKDALSKVEADRDTYKDKFESLEKESKDKELTDEQIRDAVNERVTLIDHAKNAGVEVKEEMTKLDLQKETILKVFPQADLKDKEETYIAARYDSAIELLQEKKDKETQASNNEKLFTNDTKPNVEIVDSEKARQDYINRISNQWENKEN